MATPDETPRLVRAEVAAAAIKIHVEEAVAKERERCAKIAEGYVTYDYNMADVIAKEIRQLE